MRLYVKGDYTFLAILRLNYLRILRCNENHVRYLSFFSLSLLFISYLCNRQKQHPQLSCPRPADAVLAVPSHCNSPSPSPFTITVISPIPSLLLQLYIYFITSCLHNPYRHKPRFLVPSYLIWRHSL